MESSMEIASRSETEVKVPTEVKGILRHCAFCLISVPSEKVSVCGQCKRRAYCSRECQKADWSPKGKGQGHRKWCALQCGEEDLDWELAPVSAGKENRVGIVAKRPLPSKFRIIVDAFRAEDHPLLEDLPEFKYLQSDAHDVEQTHGPVVALRIGRINNACDPNAARHCDVKSKVTILYAERDIETGEEICLGHRILKSLSRDFSYREVFSVFSAATGIVCPDNCLCRDEAYEKLHWHGRKLDESLIEKSNKGDIEGSMEFIKLLMANHEERQAGWKDKIRTLNDGWRLGILKKSTYELGKEYGRRLYEILKCIYHPEDKEIKDYLLWLEDPKTLPSYKLYEEMQFIKSLMDKNLL